MYGKSGGLNVNRLAGRGVLLVALLLAVLLVGMSGGVASATAPYQLTPTPEPTEPAGDEDAAGVELGEEVVLEEAGFAFSPPAGWQVVDMEQDETAGMVLAIPVEDMTDTNLLLIGLGPVEEVDQEATTLPELAEAVAESFDDDQVTISEARETSFNGLEALAYDISGLDDLGQEMAGRLVISLVDGDRAFIFLVIGTADNWNEERVQAVFDSVRLLERAAGEETEPTAGPSATADLGPEVTETIGQASLTVAAPEGWDMIRQEDAFGSRIDLTLLPAGAGPAAAPGMRLVLDLNRSWLAGEAASLEALVSGLMPYRQAAALEEGAEITASDPEAIEVGGLEGLRVDWEKTGAGGDMSQGMLVLALLGAAPTSPVFVFEASAPTEEWDSGLAVAVLDTVQLEGAAQARRFTLPNDGLSFTTPAGWYVETRGLEQGRAISVTPGREAYLPGFFIGVFSTGLDAADEAGLQQLAAGALLPDAAGSALLELLESEEIEVGGLPATAYELSGPAGLAEGSLIVVPLEDGRALVIAGAAPAGDLETGLFFEDFVDSVSLDE